MTVAIWIAVGIWGLVLLASAAIVLPRLPAPIAEVPPYQLWWRGEGDPPPLEPAPARIHRGAEPPDDGPDRVLLLATAAVDPRLPGHLAACGGRFVSVFPLPVGGLLAQARERTVRDLAQAEKVRDPRHPAGFADGRCVWASRVDFTLPGAGVEPGLRAARARKAHGLAVDLRDPRGADGAAKVRAPGRSAAALRAGFADAIQADRTARAILVGLPLLLVGVPIAALIVPETRLAGLLAFGIGAAARGMTALRDGFGGWLTLVGPATDLAVASEIVRAPLDWPRPVFPTLPEAAPQQLTGAAASSKGRWLEAAGVPYLARHLGGATAVMEQIYANQPVGRTALGRIIDARVHASPAARAVRHRFVMTVAAGRARAPRSLLSIPCGGGRDAAAIGAARSVLIDPDPHARQIAAAHAPNATVVAGTLDDLPDATFDLVLFIGLAEYLDDATLTRGLQALRARLADGGALLCTTTAFNADQGRMGRLLGWNTRARSPDALARVLDAAGFQVEARSADPLGIQWLFVARPWAVTAADGSSAPLPPRSPS